MFYYEGLLSALETEEQKTTATHIFERYESLMFHIAFDYVKNESDAEDLVMQVAENICNNIEAFIGKDDKSLARMVARYTRNAATNKYHELKRKATVSFDETYMEDESREEAITEFECSILTDGEHFGYLQEYVTKLPEAYQHVLMYRYVEEMNCRQIAKLLNMSESTVSTRVNRALKQLARLFEEGRMRG